MTNGERDVLDDYLDQSRAVANPLTSQYVEEHSGHRLFCPSCKRFRRTRIELTKDETGAYLRVACKTCDTYSDFVPRKDGVLVPKWFSDASRRFAMARTREFLREEAEKDAVG